MTYPTKKVSECVVKVAKKGSIQTSQYLEGGDFPVVDQGQGLIAGYTNDQSVIYANITPVVIFGDHTRALKFVDFPFAVGADGTKILKPTEDLNPKFFYYMLLALDLGGRGYARHFRLLKDKEIPLPPLETQKKIVAKVDDLFAKIKEAKKLRAEAQEDAANLLPSALHKIFEEGKEKGWEEKELHEIANLNPKKSEVRNEKDDLTVSFIPMSAINEYSQSIEFQYEKELGEVRKGYTYCKNGDVLFSKITPCMENGKIAMAKDLKNGIGFGTTEFHVIRPSEKVLADWIYQVIRTKAFRNEAERHMTGSAGQKRVPKEYLEKVKVPVPPLSEQKQIVEYLDSLSEKTDQIQDLQSQTATDITDLEQSILHKAFESELVKEEGEIESSSKLTPYLTISGPVAEGEYKEAKEYFSSLGIVINQKYTFSLEASEVIQIAFQNLDFYELVRNGVLFNTLTLSVKKVFEWLKKNIEEDRRPKKIGVPLIFEKSGKTLLFINVFANENTLPKLLKEIEKRFTEEYVNNIKKQEMWAVEWDEDKDEIRIFKIGE